MLAFVEHYQMFTYLLTYLQTRWLEHFATTHGVD